MPADAAERNAVLLQQVREMRLRQQNALLEAELTGEIGSEVVLIKGLPVPIRVQVAGHKHRLSGHDDQINAIKRIQGANVKYAGKSLKELQDFNTLWRNKFATAEFGGRYPRVSDTARIAIALASLEGITTYQWSKKTEPEKTSYATWDSYIVYLRTLIADPENRLAALTLRLKEC